MFDTYMQFMDYDRQSGSPASLQAQIAGDTGRSAPTIKDGRNSLRDQDYNFDIEQVLNIGSQSSGATSGKVTFNPFSITRKIDRLSPLLFAMCCTGEHFQIVSLYLRRAGGQGGQAAVASAAGQGRRARPRRAASPSCASTSRWSP